MNLNKETIKMYFEGVNKTTKLLFMLFAGMIFVLILISIIQLKEIKFNDLQNAVAVSESNYNIDLGKIKRVEVRCNITLGINYSESEQYGLDLIKNQSDELILKQNHDTLKIYFKKYDSQKMYRYGKVYSMRGINVSQIKATGYAYVFLCVTNNDSLVISTEENASVECRNKEVIRKSRITAKDNSYVGLTKYENTILDLKDNSWMILKGDNTKIEGMLRNKTHIRLTGKNIDLCELVKQDSSAVIHR